MSDAPDNESSHATEGSAGFDRRSLIDVAIFFGTMGVIFVGGELIGLGFFGPAAVVLGVCLATFLLHRRGQSWSALGMGIHRKWWKTAVGALVATIVLFFVAGIAVYLLSLAGLGQPDISGLGFIRTTWWGLPLLLAIVWTTAAFGEEMLFRGFLLNLLAQSVGSGKLAFAFAALVQAGLFGLAHMYQGPVGMITTATIGLALAVIYLSTKRNLWIPILSHGLFNTVQLTLLWAGFVPGQTTSIVFG